MRVLLAEDEVTIFVTLRDALEDAGHEVIGATDTASALKALDLEPAADAVVTDVRMPGVGASRSWIAPWSWIPSGPSCS